MIFNCAHKIAHARRDPLYGKGYYTNGGASSPIMRTGETDELSYEVTRSQLIDMLISNNGRHNKPKVPLY